MYNDQWTSDEQCTLISTIVRSLQNVKGDIVELGAWEGKMSVQLANSAYPETLHCVDWWKGNITEEVEGQVHITRSILETRNVQEIFISNVASCTRQNVTLYIEDCNEWLKYCTLPIKFCYVDASHDYPSVKETLTLLLSRMVPGGIICGSDFLSAGENRLDLQGGVQRAVKEVLPTYKNVDNTWLYQHPA